MAEEKTKTEGKSEGKQEPTDRSNIEKIAIKLGWNPDHEGGDRAYVGAEEYILRSREIQDTSKKQLKSTRRQVSDLERGLEALKRHNEQVYEVQVANLKKEIRKLKKERKEADEDGNTELVKELDKEIEEIDKIPAKAPVPETKSNPDFIKWLDKNSWYENDKEMQIYADIQGQSADLAGLPASKFYDAITDRVKKHFPEKFEAEGKVDKKTTETKEPKATSVEGPTPRRTRQPKFTYKDLSDEQKKNCKFFVDRGVMSQEDYIKQLADIGQLK
jgi:hypothetical protein